jgi:citrate lyase subunit beta/citryl-CoA lyase
MLDKALGFYPDAYVPDMEDSVPDSEKHNARQAISAFLARLGASGSLVIPRVNALDTGLMEDDLAAVVGPHIHGISIGKVQNANDIRAISELLRKLEKRAGVKHRSTRLLPWIETAPAIVHSAEICMASTRIVAVAFGAEDFTNDMGIERLEDESQLAYARSAVCIGARAAGVLALDTPYFKFRDQEGLEANLHAAKGYGFKGKFAIHPAQVEHINRAFSPSQAEIEYSQRIVAAFEEAERNGRGSTSLEGKVIDVPVAKRARAVLEIAAASARATPQQG